MVEAPNYDSWMVERLFLLHQVGVAMQQFAGTFEAFPPRAGA